MLLAGSTLLGLELARAVRRHALVGAEAARRAELEGAMLAEAHHRVKNSLQVVAELLLLGRPEDAESAAAFDRAAERIHSIAAVHQVLASRRGGRVQAPELLDAVVAGYEDVHVDAEPVELPFPIAQNLGVIVNELVTNAIQHGVAAGGCAADRGRRVDGPRRRWRTAGAGVRAAGPRAHARAAGRGQRALRHPGAL